MKYNLEDLSVMIASLLTIYESGIYMPYTSVLDSKYVVFIANINNIDNIKTLSDISKYDDCLLLYMGNILVDDIIIKNDKNYNNYPYINDFIEYLLNNQNKYMSISDIICDFLNMNYLKPRKRIKL